MRALRRAVGVRPAHRVRSGVLSLDRRTLLRVLAGSGLAACGGKVAGAPSPSPSLATPPSATVAAPPPPAPSASHEPPLPEASPHAPPAPPTPSAPSPHEVRLICRDAWGAAPPTAPFASHVIERLTLHHSAVTVLDPREAPGRLRADQRYHQDSGFPDIAYHVVVDPAGYAYEGRPLDAPGDTFTGYDPSGHLLVTAEGNFDEQPLSEEQLATLVDAAAWGVATFGFDVASIAGHRDYAATACPGAAIIALLDDGTFHQRVADRIARGGGVLTPFCGDEARALVAAIEAGTA